LSGAKTCDWSFTQLGGVSIWSADQHTCLLRWHPADWRSVLMNNPWVNGEPKVVEYAMRTGPLRLKKEKGGPKQGGGGPKGGRGGGREDD